MGRNVDGVYLQPGTMVAVMERGSMFAQMRHASERCLILGVGVLDGMKLRPFRAILAHEFGHFSNRDTAGGGLALSVRRSMIHMAASLIRRDVEFGAKVDHTIDEVLKEKRGLANLYTYTPGTTPEGDVEKEIAEALGRKPTAFDSHPAPSDRIRWVHNLGEGDVPAAADDADDVWTLFRDRTAIEEKMTDAIRSTIAESHGLNIPKYAVAGAATET